MKKLMIAVAMIALAVTTAQAAHFKWGFSASKSTVPADSKFDGATVYMVLASDVANYMSTHEKGFEKAADITGMAKSQGTLTAGQMSTTTGAIEVKSSTKEGEWNFGTGNIDWYAFIIDGDKYYQTKSIKTSVAKADNDGITPVTYTSNAELGDSSNFTKFAGTPEPTSGLLLLLGVAGLALRRRRA